MLKRVFAAVLTFMLMVMCVGAGCAYAESTYIDMEFQGSLGETENGYVFVYAGYISWDTDGDAYGYKYLIEDMQGFDVQKYSYDVLSDTDGVEIYAQDFILNAPYTITVYAYDGPDDTDPIFRKEWFVFVDDMNSSGGSDDIITDDKWDNGWDNNDDGGNTDNVIDTRKERFAAYYERYIAMGDSVVLADVTGDGQEEMIVVIVNDGWTDGYVYTVDEEGAVVLIYQNVIPHSHGGVCGWYLVPQADGGYALLEECDEVWQGIGTLYYLEYRLTEDGTQVYLRNLWLSSDQPGCVDSNGMILDFLYDDFAEQLSVVLSEAYSLYVHSSWGGGCAGKADLSYNSAFGGGYVDPFELINQKGLISMIDMEYESIYYALTDMAYFDSFDNPGVWYLTGRYAGGYVNLEYYTEPEEPGAYPYRMTVVDPEGNLYLPVTLELLTGMTWGQVQMLYWDSVGDIEAYDGYAIAYAYPEQGCVMTLVFTDDTEYGILTSVQIDYFE